MKSKIAAILLCIVIAIAATACRTEDPPPTTNGDAPPTTNGSAPQADNEDADNWDIPGDLYIATLDGSGVSAVDFAYFFMIYRNHWTHSAIMSGFDPDTFWDIDDDGITVRQSLINEALRVSKEYEALYNLAVAAGISEGIQEGASADDQIASLLEQVDNDEDAFQHAFLLTPVQIREAIRRINVAAGYLNAEMEAIDVTEADIQAAYEEMPPGFEQVTVRHVLISSDDSMSEQERREAAELAQSILDRINAGEDIGVLAAQYSDDPGSRFEDGEYTFGRGMMVTEFEQWSFEAQPGDTGIVSTMFGYHVMQKMSGVNEQLEQHARHNLFRQQHSWLYEMLESDEWVINQEVIDRFAAML